MIEINDVKIKFNELAINYPNITIKEGQLALICADSGKGKSTLCEIMAGFLYAESGDIFYQKQLIQDCTKRVKNLNVFNYVHYLSQFPDFNLIGPTCVSELLFWRYNQDDSVNTLKDIKLTMSYFNLIENNEDMSILDKPVWKLSFGKKKALAFCVLMLINRPVWVLDEPFAGLDKFLKEKFKSCMKDFLLNKGIILATSHNAYDYKDFNPTIYYLR